jgi:hypothetical protein
LNGQLTLASAVIQQKDSLIQQQQSFIQQQVLIDSIQNEREQEADKEPIVEGLVSVKNYDWGPFEFDLATILRRLKQQFGKHKQE